MPIRCGCGGQVEATDETTSTIVQDIPPPPPVENVEHVTRVGRCARCGQRVSAKLPGAVADGQSVAHVQLGPNVQALIIDLRFKRHVSLAGISGLLGVWFGLDVTPGGISQLITRLAVRDGASYLEARDRVRQADVLGLDETGLRQDGLGGWAWLARTDEVSFFQVELSRGAWVAEQMLGDEYTGVVCSDFYGVYTARDDLRHAYCGAHNIREVRKIAEVDPGDLTETFRDQIVDWYADGKRAQACGSRAEREELRQQLYVLVTQRPSWEHSEVKRMAARLHEHFEGVTLFLDHRKIPADNNATERDIRPIARHRKMTGGTRSPRGSRALGHWMTITQTLDKGDRDLRTYMVGAHAAHLAGRPPPSLFGPD